MFTVLFGAFAVVVFVLMCFGFYIFAAFVFYRLGEKFRVGSFLGFLIPIYNVMLLCDCAKLTRWLTVGLLFPGFVASVMNVASLHMLEPYVKTAGLLIGFAANVLLWGSIAKRLGKNFWLWGIITTVLCGLPVLILAFDSSLPVPESRPRSGQLGPDQGDGPHADEQSENKDENNNHEETRYIDVQ